MRRLIVAALLAATVSAPAFAGDQDFKLVNKTGYTINEVYVGPVSAKTWGKDVMGTGTLDADASVDITFTAPASVCQWDLKVTYDDKTSAEWSNLNLCNISTVTLYWDQKNQVSRAVTN